MTRQLFIANSPDDLAREAAARFADAAGRAIEDHGRFSVALSGGSTPRRLYSLLAQPPYLHAVDWTRVHIFFADERYVPPDHPDSTLLLARETLLNHVPIPPENIFAMPTEGDTPEADAARYAESLQSFFDGAPLPRLDLVLLGMGPDGHTASLFPGRPDYPGAVAAIFESPKPPPVRLTLTLDAINRAAQIWFLVTGADKAEPVRAMFRGEPAGLVLPAGRVEAGDGATVWLLDREAGAGVMDLVS
ncbi:6-phosphogluconolactonase [Methylomagnum sp.]